MSYSFRRPSKDDNHAAVVDALRKAGCHVTDLSGVGGGVPDLIVARGGHLSWLEVKNDETHGRRAKGDVPHYELLTDEQVAWLAEYGEYGPPVRIVTTPAEALAAIGAVNALDTKEVSP